MFFYGLEMIKRLQCIVFIWCISHCQAWTQARPSVFPEDFSFGVATSAFQIEGGFEDGRGASICDDHIASDGNNGTEACDSYNLYKTDVKMLRELGVDHYRFSVAWSRVLPDGYPNNQNELGLKYYDNLLDELIKYKIEPMVTLYHFDLPKSLQDLGGWTNPSIVDWFEDYARVLFQRYGPKVKYWLTVNQIDSICIGGYGRGNIPPFVKIPGVADYLCVKNALLAHARVWRLYDKEFRKTCGGSIGIALALNWYESINNATENLAAAELQRDFNVSVIYVQQGQVPKDSQTVLGMLSKVGPVLKQYELDLTFGIYTHPIFSEFGDFPKTVRDTVARKSKEQGFSNSRLPELSAQEIKYIKGTSDFIGINHYTTYLVESGRSALGVPSFDDDVGGKLSFGKLWKRSKSDWQANASYGLYKLLLYLNKNYNYSKTIITETGWSTDPFLYDEGRIEYLKEYLYAVRLAMEDGAKVYGYTVWSLMDNFEWGVGFSDRFGLYHVDIESANKTRQPRKSALYYREVIETRTIVDTFESNSLRISISNRRIRNKEEL